MTRVVSFNPDSLRSLVKLLERSVPNIIDLVTAKTDDDFDDCLEIHLEKAVDHLETNAKNFADLDEEGLSAVLAGVLKMPGLRVMQEANSNGHVDITIEVELAGPIRRRLAEAKIDRGPVYHEKGLQQLLERYLTGREGRGWLIVYVKKRHIKTRIQDVRDHFDQTLPCRQQCECSDHQFRWAFESTHLHNSGESVPVTHMGCNLFFDRAT